MISRLKVQLLGGVQKSAKLGFYRINRNFGKTSNPGNTSHTSITSNVNNIAINMKCQAGGCGFAWAVSRATRLGVLASGPNTPGFRVQGKPERKPESLKQMAVPKLNRKHSQSRRSSERPLITCFILATAVSPV